MERADGKAAGDDGFIPARGSAEQMERAPTPYQTRRAVRVVTRPLHQMWQITRTQMAVAPAKVKTNRSDVNQSHLALTAAISRRSY